MTVARQQRARSLELRATVSLCQLWRQQDKRGRAQEQLAELYATFDEGLDTIDLRKAKALLDREESIGRLKLDRQLVITP